VTPDGSVKIVLVVAHALRDESGSIEFVGARNGHQRSKAGGRQNPASEMELRQLLDFAPQYVAY